MNSKERHEARYQRRKKKRQNKLIERQSAVGDLETAMSYYNLYSSGKASCTGVRWKSSVQNFELRLFSRTARSRQAIINKTWKPRPPVRFFLHERGHVRLIAAPHIEDRQVYKAFSRHVLRPLYEPHLIYDNGASMKNKGFAFAQRRVICFLSEHFRRYGKSGAVILIDFRKFFPTAPHKTITENHKQYILDADEYELAEKIISTFGQKGMDLGVEVSQVEASALPNRLDHYIKDFLRAKAERYMDDILICAKDENTALRWLTDIKHLASEDGLTVNTDKTRILTLSDKFKYCQWRYSLTETGRIIKRVNRKSVIITRRKLKKLSLKYEQGRITFEDILQSYTCWLGYIARGNSHNLKIRADALFYKLFYRERKKIC